MTTHDSYFDHHLLLISLHFISQLTYSDDLTHLLQSLSFFLSLLFYIPFHHLHFRVQSLLFNYLYLWHEYLTAEIFWGPPLYIQLNWKGNSGSPFEPWPLSARKMHATVDKIVDLNNPLRDICGAYCYTLAQSFRNHKYNYVHGMITIYFSTTSSP